VASAFAIASCLLSPFRLFAFEPYFFSFDVQFTITLIPGPCGPAGWRTRRRPQQPRAYTISLLSGDQTGSRSGAGSVMSFSPTPRATSTSQMSQLPAGAQSDRRPTDCGSGNDTRRNHLGVPGQLERRQVEFLSEQGRAAHEQDTIGRRERDASVHVSHPCHARRIE
jgi:hypothetical protein